MNGDSVTKSYIIILSTMNILSEQYWLVPVRLQSSRLVVIQNVAEQLLLSNKLHTKLSPTQSGPSKSSKLHKVVYNNKNIDN